MTRESRTTSIVSYVLLVFLVVLALFPFVVAIITSFKTHEEVYHTPFIWIPKMPTLANYYYVIIKDEFWRYFFNSVFVASVTTFIAVCLAIMAGYGFSRYKFKGRNVLKLGSLASYLVPTAVLFLPFYLLMNQLKLLNSLWSLVLTYSALNMPISILMMSGYFASIPKELDEAAIIDGCSRIRTLLKIILPLASPGIVSVALFCFISSWQEFLFALIYIEDIPKRTLALGLATYNTPQHGVMWGNMMAATIFAVLPTTIVFVFFQKRLIAGLTKGALKE